MLRTCSCVHGTRLTYLTRTIRRGLRDRAASVDVRTESTNHETDESDFFGINDVTNKDIAGEYVLDGKQNPVEKFAKLQQSRTQLDNEETRSTKTFGKIRLDSQNIPAYHGQYDPDNQRLAFEIEGEASYLQFVKPQHVQKKDEVQSSSKTNSSDLNDVDSQYFAALNETPSESQVKDVASESAEATESNFIDSQYFEEFFPRAEEGSVKEPMAKFKFTHTDFFHDWLSQGLEKGKDDDSKFNEYRMSRDSALKDKLSVIEGIKLSRNSPLKSADELAEDFDHLRDEKLKMAELEEDMEPESPELATVKLDVTPKQDVPKPRTGLEYVEQLRNKQIEPETERMKDFMNDKKNYRLAGEDLFSKLDQSGKELDSKGYRTYRDTVFDLSKLRKLELLRYLKDRIIYCDNGILAIDKPYGLCCQGTSSREKAKERKYLEPVLFDMLADFADLLVREGVLPRDGPQGAPRLHTIHRLDKEVTGVLVLATDANVARTVHRLFAERRVEKTYLALTRNVPAQEEGIIDIPVEVGSVDGKQRMVLRPELREELRRVAAPSVQAKRAVTYYKTLASVTNAAILKVVPETGVKHQIRVHLGLGLRCPILGDHKYSYLEKLAPQRLPSDMLVALNVRQSKVRNMPMHLHAKEVVIPEVGPNGSHLFLRTALPDYFRATLSRLKLYI
ncbi:Mitochondrial RNA pseudouridine synthase Rpusd4 [Halotydeus destructor]|nr:Mitochondrial RNA pseudouridine synthase Rpusd4 [Halotydeus destructor]